MSAVFKHPQNAKDPKDFLVDEADVAVVSMLGRGFMRAGFTPADLKHIGFLDSINREGPIGALEVRETSLRVVVFNIDGSVRDERRE